MPRPCPSAKNYSPQTMSEDMQIPRPCLSPETIYLHPWQRTSGVPIGRPVLSAPTIIQASAENTSRPEQTIVSVKTLAPGHD